MSPVATQVEANSPRHLVSALSGPGALDLVVEMVHDLRSPLTSILALSEMLMRGESGEVNEAQRRQLAIVYGSALKLSAVTNDVIELAEGGGRLVDNKPAPFCIREVFESVADMVRPIAEEKGLAVRIKPTGGDRRAGHRSALTRILLNLTTNALRFTEDGYVELAVTPSGTFSVRDTGKGIPPAALSTLYEPFRPSRTRNEYLLCDRGLGLSICRKLLRAMGSDLEVETRTGWGTRFHFQLDWPRERNPRLS